MKRLAAFLVASVAFALTLSLSPNSWVRTDVHNGLYAVPQTGPTPIAITGGWAVDFPDASTGYFLARVQQTQKKHTSISGTMTVTFKVVTTGTPTFLWNSEPFNTGTYPANIRPHFYVRRPQSGVYGWWGHEQPETFPNIVWILTNVNNTTTVSFPLIPSQWSNNLGHYGDFDSQTAQIFAIALNDVDTIGVSIGGGNYFGHGVNVSGGTAQLQVLSISTF